MTSPPPSDDRLLNMCGQLMLSAYIMINEKMTVVTPRSCGAVEGLFIVRTRLSTIAPITLFY